MGKYVKSEELPQYEKRPIWQKLTKPSKSIKNKSERRQVRLISAFLLFIAVGMSSWVIYTLFLAPLQSIGIVLASAQLLFFVAYLLSRTRYYQYGIHLSIFILLLIPIFNIVFSTDHSSEILLMILIWSIFVLLYASIFSTLRMTILLSLITFVILISYPIFFKDITYSNLAVPSIFIIFFAIALIIFTHHRNLLEKDRTEEIKKINFQLQFELSERIKVEEKLAYTALHDSLTDLPNRALFMDRLKHAFAYAKRHKEFTFAVCFIDLDRFKVINDSLGHNIGDLLLVESAKRLTRCIRSMDTVARLGGDEFVILFEGAEKEENYLRILDRIQQELSVPAVINNYDVYISVSMGIVLNPSEYETADEILRNADIAMYQTKKAGRGHYRIFDQSMLDGVMTRLEMENDLRNALDLQQFLLYYQPIFNIHSKQIIGFEALLRWQHPTKGLILPGEFISIIEDMGLIIPIGYWVIDEACRQIKQWQMEFKADLSVNVNLSTKQCSQPELADRINEILEKYQLSPSSLRLELTESLIIEDSELVSNTLSKLQKLGIQIQIDDFGTGYSSLGYLHTLPIDTLKIDRIFINRLGISDSSMDIVRTILALSHGMGMKVIAEGVETEQQLSILESMQCEFVQGFLFAKPLNKKDASNLLSKN